MNISLQKPEFLAKLSQDDGPEPLVPRSCAPGSPETGEDTFILINKPFKKISYVEQEPAKGDLDFVAFGFDFVAPGLDSGALGLFSVARGLDFQELGDQATGA